MLRKLISGLWVIFLLAAFSWAADPFLGTWTVDVARMKQQIKDLQDLPPGVVADTLKVEAYKEGYKLTQTIGKGTSHPSTHITIVDFKTGITAVRDAQGEEIDRVKVVRVSPTEIETTSLKYGGIVNYRIIDGGNEIEVRMFEEKGAKPDLTGYYKRVQ